MAVSNSVFVLRLLTAQELIASFSTNAYRVSGPNFARRCVVECRCCLWCKRKIDEIASCTLFWPVLKNYILRWMVGLCIDGHRYSFFGNVQNILPLYSSPRKGEFFRLFIASTCSCFSAKLLLPQKYTKINRQMLKSEWPKIRKPVALNCHASLSSCSAT